MKNLSFVLLAIFATFATSCKKDAQPAPDSAAVITSQKDIVVSNNWSVALFTEHSTIRTAEFNTFLFQFESSLNAVAKKTSDNTLFNGTWNLVQGNHSTPDDSGNHSSGTEDHKFIIEFSGNPLLSEISEDWAIVKLTDTEIWLRDDNLASPKEIHFVKN